MKEAKAKSEIKKGAITGFWSGILASLCCTGPLLIILFGLGSVSFALSLTQYRPYFLGLGFFFMIGAIFWHLKKKNKSCGVNCFSAEGLKREKRFVTSVVLSMGVTYILILYVLVPALSPAVYISAPSKTPQSPTLNKLTVKISGMTCPGCATAIENILHGLEGVVEAKVSYPEGTGEIVYNQNITSKEKIISSKAFSIYPAQIINDERISEEVK